ncbi:hypothetical protein DMW99_14740 [Pseudomonas chlororaphis]|nr:hypothetical protein C1Y36_10410 [Pseudomonas sp. FW306-2-2C-D06C]PYC36639.1 hypothetical protein DMW99_14740 [Pseudomonas chlororaphis]
MAWRGLRGKGRLASQRWTDCIQLLNQFVSPIFCIFHRLCSCMGTARNLPGWSANGWKVFCSHGVAADQGNTEAWQKYPEMGDFYCVQFF